MPTLDDSGLDERSRARIAAVLAADPALADELALIEVALRPAARARFWLALAEESGRVARPAAAVLAALERAAAGEGS